MNLAREKKRLELVRRLAFAGFFAGIVVVCWCLVYLARTPGHWRTFFWGLSAVLFFFHLAAFGIRHLLKDKKHRVGREGNSWRVGKYSEAQVRDAVLACVDRLPPGSQAPRVSVSEDRETTGWTWLPFFWPGWDFDRVVWLSSGALHYLERDELQALILHEVAHHDRANRLDVPFGWVLVDVASWCLAVVVGAQFDLGISLVIFTFLGFRSAIINAVSFLQGNLPQTIEHFCDLAAADGVGRKAVVNMLLKLGEEVELTEVVIARVAAKLLPVQPLDLEDIVMAFREVRPYGRVFHDSLLRHSAETITQIVADLGPKEESLPPKKNGKPNPQLKEFLDSRRRGKQARIRWRTFNGDGDSQLAEEEIAALCDALEVNPAAALFSCESERNPTSHPRFRDRILVTMNS